MRTFIKKLVPAALRPALGNAWWKLQHKYTTVKLFGREAAFVPPLSLMYDGPAGYQEFKENGAEFLGHYIALCDLGPNESVLDIGSGTGRKTLPLLGYLTERGSYLGMEFVKSGVDWCREKYAAFPNFKFQEIDVLGAPSPSPPTPLPAGEGKRGTKRRVVELLFTQSVMNRRRCLCRSLNDFLCKAY